MAKTTQKLQPLVAVTLLHGRTLLSVSARMAILQLPAVLTLILLTGLIVCARIKQKILFLQMPAATKQYGRIISHVSAKTKRQIHCLLTTVVINLSGQIKTTKIVSVQLRPIPSVATATAATCQRTSIRHSVCAGTIKLSLQAPTTAAVRQDSTLLLNVIVVPRMHHTSKEDSIAVPFLLGTTQKSANAIIIGILALAVSTMNSKIVMTVNVNNI
jgi:hypothetical protein